MRAVCWHGIGNVRVESVAATEIMGSRDAIVRVTSTGISGSDLHFYNGYFPSIVKGSVLGREAIGEVVEIGSSVRKLMIGDRVIVPAHTTCGECYYCGKYLYSFCEGNTIYDGPKLDETDVKSGSQAEYVRVPFADSGPLILPPEPADQQLLPLSSVFPAGYMAAENCGIEPGDSVAVWGCGAVGQFAIKSAWMLGAGRVFAIDNVTGRLEMAATNGLAETINFDMEDVPEALAAMTDGRGPDRCIDAVGCEAHAGGTFDGSINFLKSSAFLAADRPHVYRQTIMACRKGGTISIPGVYVGYGDKIPIGAAMNKGLTIKQGRTDVRKYIPLLLKKILDGEIDPSYVITHEIPLDDAAMAYRIFNNKSDDCVKVILKP